jgi:hypothetical protein
VRSLDTYGFQLIRFNPIGREFVAEPLPREGFRHQIDAPSKKIVDRHKNEVNNMAQIQSWQGIDAG